MPILKRLILLLAILALCPSAQAQKVSSFSGATVPLTGAEQLYIIQGGVSHNGAVSSLSSAVNVFNVLSPSCGAVGNGTTNDTAAFNACLTLASNAGAGVVLLPVKKYLVDPFTVPSNVCLVGMGWVPESSSSFNVASTTATAPVLLINSYTTNFILLNYGACVQGLEFYDPNQVAPTASTPTAHPAAITVPQSGGGCTIADNLFVNVYQGIYVQSGRCRIYDNKIGAFSNCFQVDAAFDTTIFNNNQCDTYWDIYAALSVPQTIDTWVQANRNCFIFQRIDEIQGVNDTCFIGNTGVQLIDTGLGSNPTSGYGTLTNWNLDSVNVGIYGKSTNCGGGGFKFHNLDVEANPSTGQAAISLVTGGTASPCVGWQGGSIQGAWVSTKGLSIATGTANIRNVYGLNPYGPYTAPAFPASAANLTNTTGLEQRVCITGGTISSLKIGGTATGISSGCLNLEENEVINITYSGTPSWQWFAN